MRVWNLSLAGLLILSGLTHAQADDAAVRKEIAAKYVQIDVALNKRDAKALDSLLAPEYVLFSNGRQTTKQALLARERDSSQAGWFRTGWHEKLVGLKVKGKDAVVDAEAATTYPSFDRQHRPGTKALVNVFRDEWVKSNQGWQLKHQEIVKQYMTFNGKPI